MVIKNKPVEIIEDDGDDIILVTMPDTEIKPSSEARKVETPSILKTSPLPPTRPDKLINDLDVILGKTPDIVIKDAATEKPVEAPKVIRVNTSVPNDGREYYCTIVFNGHSNTTLAYKLRNRQIVEVASDKITSNVVDPETFTFEEIAKDIDHKY